MKVLLVEDEAKLSEALTVLIGRAGYAVETALDGQTGLDMIRAHTYDCIILDRMLPRLDGLSVLKSMRLEKNDTPVLLLTAKDAPSERVAGLEAGADDYLVKPFYTEELLARIKALTRRHVKKAPEGVICAAGIALYKMRGEAAIGEKKYQLTVKEAALLALLMENKGQVITKDRIMEKIWGYDSDASMANVDLYIYYLRKKLNLSNIKTIRGVGYTFESEK